MKLPSLQSRAGATTNTSFCIRNISKTKSKPAKKNTGWCFSTEMKATCKNSANLEQETKTTKIVTYPLLSLASSCVCLKWEIGRTYAKVRWPTVFQHCMLRISSSFVAQWQFDRTLSNLKNVIKYKRERFLFSSLKFNFRFHLFGEVAGDFRQSSRR